VSEPAEEHILLSMVHQASVMDQMEARVCR
jgi:hypothetical protein